MKNTLIYILFVVSALLFNIDFGSNKPIDPTDNQKPQTTVLGGPVDPTNLTTASFIYESSEANSTFECQMDSGSWSSCPTTTTEYTGLSLGLHTFSVRATDDEGDRDRTPATWSWTISNVDTTAPDAPVITSPNNNTTTNLTATGGTLPISGTAEPLTTLELFDGATSKGTTSVNSDGEWSYNLTIGVDGQKVYAADTTDASNNKSVRSNQVRVWVDRANPDATITSGPAEGSSQANQEATFEFTGSDTIDTSTTFECKMDAGSYAPCTSPKSYTGLSGSGASHTFSVRAVDDAGNVDGTPATRTFTITSSGGDVTPPDTTITSTDLATTNSTGPSFTFNSTESGTFECSIDGGTYSSCTSAKSYSALDVGAHTFEVRAKDTAGNTDPTPALDRWTIYNHTLSSGSCSGTQINPGDDIATIINNVNTTNTVFCINDGDYTITTEIETEDGMKFIGMYSDGTRPSIDAGTQHFVFRTAGDSGTYFEALKISGAEHEDEDPGTADCPFGSESECGRGIGGGGTDMRVWNARITQNENAGIGGVGAGLIIRNSELDNNGQHSSSQDGGLVSAAGVKSVYQFSIYDSYVHDNYWDGIWCDEECNDAVAGSSGGQTGNLAVDIEGNRINDNGKAGIHMEISSGPTNIDNNTLDGNGEGAQWGTRTYPTSYLAGMLIIGAHDQTVTNNVFAGTNTNNGRAIIVANDAGNRSYADNPSSTHPVLINNNALNGDTITGCSLTGVTCSSNTAN